MSVQPLSRSSSMKSGAKVVPAGASLTLLSACLVLVCWLLAMAELSQPAGATSINIFKHRYPFYGGYYPHYGGGHGGGFGGGYGGISIGGFGYGRR